MLWVCIVCDHRQVNPAVRCRSCGTTRLAQRSLAPERGRVRSVTTLRGQGETTSLAVVSLRDLDIFCVVQGQVVIDQDVVVEQLPAGGFGARAETGA